MKKVLFFYTVIGLVLAFVVVITILSLAPNPITLNYKIPYKKELYKLTPQGWVFFTKDVHEDYFNIYRKNDHDNYELVSNKSSSQNQFFGIKRDNRAIMHKITYLISTVEKNLWYTYQGNVNYISRDSISKLSIVAEKPMIYGEFLIAKGKPVPYEWSKSTLEIYPKMQYVILKLKNE